MSILSESYLAVFSLNYAICTMWLNVKEVLKSKCIQMKATEQ